MHDGWEMLNNVGCNAYRTHTVYLKPYNLEPDHLSQAH